MVLLMSFVVVCGGLLFALGSASDLSENSLAVLNARAFSDMIHYNVGFEKRNVYLNGGYIYVGIKLYVGVCVSACVCLRLIIPVQMDRLPGCYLACHLDAVYIAIDLVSFFLAPRARPHALVIVCYLRCI